MPIKTTKLGPGTLTLGAGALEVNAQLLGCKITPSESVETSDAIRVLSGEQLDGDENVTHTFVLEGTFLQDLGEVASVVAWSWANMGTPQPFAFVPNTAAGTAVDGITVPVPLTIGADEASETENMESDFSWRIKGVPDFTN